jgi:hypothetical protein
VPGKKRLGLSLVGGLPRANVHCTTVAVMEKRAIGLLLWEESRYRLRRLVKLSHSSMTAVALELASVYEIAGRG